MLRLLLFCSELFHLTGHLLVLCQLHHIFDFRTKSQTFRRVYFTADLLSSTGTAVYLIVYQQIDVNPVYWALIIIQAGVHISTLIFWRSWFCLQVFRLAEYQPAATWVTLIYILGTLEDIVTHAANCGLLLLA
jgi:hypothetical protein